MTDAKRCGMPSNLDLVELTNPEDAKVYLEATVKGFLIKGNQDNRRRDAWNSGTKDESRTGQKEDSKALVTIDGEGVDWTNHSEDEDYALMALQNSSDSDNRGNFLHRNKAYSQGLKKVEAYKLLNTQMSANDKFGLGYGDHRYDGILSYENEVLQSVFMNKDSELEKQPLYDRFVTADGMHVVPSPMTGNYMPSGPDIEIVTYRSGLLLLSLGVSRNQIGKETIKNQFTHSQKPKVDKKELGYGFTVVIGDHKDTTGTMSPNTMVDPVLEIDYPHRSLKNKGIVDSGCFRHMTGNKAYLAEFQDFNGGVWPVAFGGSKGYITGKCKIKTGKLDFEDVCFMKELQHFNLFSVSQMCDKKNKILFTDFECLVLSPEFKLPDENQVLLKIPRQNNMYSFNLENIVLSGGLACLIVKATTDESNKWHRRLGHVNFKNLNKLVKGNLVRGLPSKIFQNDHTCVACQKGKQHKASCKAKSVSSISHSLQLLHMDLFGPTFVRSLNHKTYCLVNTDDFRQDEGASSDRPSEAQPTPSPAPTSEVPNEPQTDSSLAQTSEVPIEHQPNLSSRPSPTTTIPDSIPETSSENLGGHSSSDKSISGNEGDMTLQSVYDLCLSLCAHVSDQAKEIQHLKAQITKLKKQAKPIIKHHRAWLKSVSLKQQFPRKSFSKKHRVHKESVSKQGRKFAKGESSVQRDPMFDEIPEDTVDHMETENAQDEGRTREMVDEDKEIDENILSTEDVLSTDKEGVSTDMEKVSTDRPIVSTDGSKVSTDRQIEGTEEQIESTDGQRKAKVLLNMSQPKAVSREKEKGVELKDIEETDRPRPTSTRSLLTLKPLPKIDPKDKGKKKIEEEDESASESDGIPEAEKKFKQLESDEEMARKIQEEWEGEEERNRIAEEKATNEALIRSFDDIKARIEADRLLAEKLQEQEREQFTIEERAKFLHDTIAAQRRFLAQQRSEAIRNRPPTKNQLRNQMMTYLKHVGNFKHAELKIKKFEEVQALYEKIKRSDEDFISIGSAEDERLIKRMNEKGVDSSKSEVLKEESKEEVHEESKEEESTRKRKLGTRKKMKSRKRRYIQNTSEDDSDKENDELRLHLTIAPDEEKEVDYEILDRKYPIKEWKTECLGTKPQTDQAEHFEEINQNVVIRSNGQKRYFSTLMRVLSIFDREDLNAVYQLVMDRFQDEIPEGFDRVLWGDLMVMFNPDDENEFWNSQLDWIIVSWKLHSSSGVHTLVTETGLVIHMLVEKKYPLRKKVLVQMLKLKLESEEDSTMALELIRFIKKLLAELEPEE
ncbi:putative ribonuclease H-like domain-containing protein [Tanacetum coccineum]